VGNADSTDECERLLCLSLRCGSWVSRKLEHCCFLTRNQVSQQHNLTVRKFERVMMCVPDIVLDLPEDRCGVVDGLTFPAEEPGSLTDYSGCKASSVPEHTNRHVRILGAEKRSIPLLNGG
jgi:hypothetical protein